MASSTAAYGRLPEIANGRFVEAKRKKSVDVRRATLEKPDGRVWVDSVSSSVQEAAVQRELLSSGSCPDRTDILRLKRGLLTDQFSFVPGFAFMDGIHDQLLVG